MSKKLVAIFVSHLDSSIMDQNLSAIYQFRKTGSGQFLQTGKFYLSPGFAKIAPWCLAHRDSISAKAPGHVNGWASSPTLSAHTRWPLGTHCLP